MLRRRRRLDANGQLANGLFVIGFEQRASGDQRDDEKKTEEQYGGALCGRSRSTLRHALGRLKFVDGAEATIVGAFEGKAA